MVGCGVCRLALALAGGGKAGSEPVQPLNCVIRKGGIEHLQAGATATRSLSSPKLRGHTQTSYKQSHKQSAAALCVHPWQPLYWPCRSWSMHSLT